MKTLNPFSGPGSLQAERQQKRREQFKIMVWTIVAANALLFAGLLIQGCQREPATTDASGNATDAASPDTNGMVAAPAKPETNAPLATAPEPAPTNTPPDATPAVAPAPAPTAAKQYTVVKGDSFYKIAKANGITTKALTEANSGVESAKLKVGQVLQLPASAESASAVSAASTTPTLATASQPTAPTSTAQTRYIVKSGDTLGRIARAHGITVRALKAANSLTSDRIVAGQSLKLPETKTAVTSGTQG